MKSIRSALWFGFLNGIALLLGLNNLWAHENCDGLLANDKVSSSLEEVLQAADRQVPIMIAVDLLQPMGMRSPKPAALIVQGRLMATGADIQKAQFAREVDDHGLMVIKVMANVDQIKAIVDLPMVVWVGRRVTSANLSRLGKEPTPRRRQYLRQESEKRERYFASLEELERRLDEAHEELVKLQDEISRVEQTLDDLEISDGLSSWEGSDRTSKIRITKAIESTAAHREALYDEQQELEERMDILETKLAKLTNPL